MHNIPDEDPSDPRSFIPYIEFYITNVCNLTCSNCNRFNDFDFKGWQRWSDYEKDYEAWSKHVRLQRVTILGGEPLLNPSVLDWVDGINRIFGKVVQVLTNGTRLNHVPDLYDRLIQFHDPTANHIRNWLGVSLHNPADRERCFEEIHKFLRGDIRYFAKDPNDPGLTWGADHLFIDSNNMTIGVWEYQEFYTAAVQRDVFGQYTLHNSDPTVAHDNCGFAKFGCHHFIKGALYKCGPVALFPEFDQQHPFILSPEDRDILTSYRPLRPEEFETRGQQFLSTIKDVIPQCKFCPEKHSMVKLQTVSKKANSTSTFD